MRRLLLLLLAGSMAGCAPPQAETRWVSPGASPAPAAAPYAALAPTPVPGSPLKVDKQEITYRREGRVLRTVIWSPPGSQRRPAVLFSHGLNGTPEEFAPLLTAWAAAGYVVIAPAYPNTNRAAAKLEAIDVLNQPADASYVLTQVLAGPLGARIDPGRLAAAGHSAGAITTVGLFTSGRDARLHAGIVLAGNGIGVGTTFNGPPAALLFVHGDADPLITYASGKATYDLVPWPKAMLTVPGGDHNEPYLRADAASFRQVRALSLTFLRLELYGDATARRSLHDDGTFDDRL